jgi:hypothetical protein
LYVNILNAILLIRKVTIIPKILELKNTIYTAQIIDIEQQNRYNSRFGVCDFNVITILSNSVIFVDVKSKLLFV